MADKSRRDRSLSDSEESRRNEQRRLELLSRDDIQRDYKGVTRRWLELAALNGDGPPMLKLSARMVRYQRGAFEDWLAEHTVHSTSEYAA